jgi:uncharacterized protein
LDKLNILEQFKGFLATPDIFPPHSNPKIETFNFPEIQITKTLERDLQKLEHPRNSVLGKRMESFFEIAIRHSDNYEPISSNIQIIQDKRTLGELDFLVLDKVRSQALHVELVYKFYVYDRTISPELNRWIGPNRKDSFSEKLNKLVIRQFPLLYNPETIKYLANLSLKAEDIEQKLCFKAQLFLPEPETLNNQKLVNPDCYTGKCLKLTEFKNLNLRENLFHSPKKKDWSSFPAHNQEWYTFQEILEQIKIFFEREKSPLIWMKTRNSYESFFLVWW